MNIHAQRGFSLIEVAIALSLTVGLTSLVFMAVHPVDGVFVAQSEAADLQQRLRVATGTLLGDLRQAGAGAISGTHEGPLVYFFAPVLPYTDGRFGDGPGVFRDDTVSLMYVPSGSPVSTIATPLAAQSGTVDLDMGGTCELGVASCGFREGMGVLVFDDSGAYARFTVEASLLATLDLRHDGLDSVKTFAPGSKIIGVESSTYSIGVDQSSGISQLIRTGRDSARHVPVVDHVVGLQFEYYGDPRPPTMRLASTSQEGPWTTYGPHPPDSSLRIGTYPPGENCVFASAGGVPVPRLPELSGSGSPALVRFQADDFQDGPWCPDGSDPNRFDADLLRIRAVDVTVRVESSLAALRGPASSWFFRGGGARRAEERVPDIEIQFRVTPRNLHPDY